VAALLTARFLRRSRAVPADGAERGRG